MPKENIVTIDTPTKKKKRSIFGSKAKTNPGKTTTRKPMSPKKKVKVALIKLLIKLLSIIAIITILLTVVGGIFVCHDNDNFPHIKDGDLLITYRLTKFYSGDVVVYEVDGHNYIGRVVGVPGDVIDFTDNYYTVNGIAPYETVYYKTEPRESSVKYPYEVKEGEVFVLADYREEGKDSRLFGAVNKLKGKVVFTFRSRGF